MDYEIQPQTPGEPDHAAPDDARNRAWRTLLQGLLLDVLAAVALVVYEAVSAEEPDLRLLLILVGKTALTTAASYVHRKLQPPADA